VSNPHASESSAAIQIQKGYASVLDGPGAMGGAINLVTMTPTKRFEAEGGLSAGGRDIEGGNAKIGFTPNATNEYTLNFTKQSGENGAPLNMYNNPPVPPNSHWRWPWWDVQNTSFLTTTQLGAASYLEAKAYYPGACVGAAVLRRGARSA